MSMSRPVVFKDVSREVNRGPMIYGGPGIFRNPISPEGAMRLLGQEDHAHLARCTLGPEVRKPSLDF